MLGYLDDLSNWGRWGPDDELGTLNLISAEKRARAAGLAVRGETISCAWDLDLGAVAEQDEGPRQRFFRATGEGLRDVHRLRPAWMGATDRQSSASEYIGMVFHGLGVTAQDVSPSGYETVRFPIHIVGIVAMGLWLLDNCDLEELARTCAAHDR